MFALLPVVAKVISIVSVLLSLWQFVDFANSLRKFNEYRTVVAQVQATGDLQAVAAIPAVAAPDVSQWLSWLGPGLVALVSWGIGNWVKNPQLVSVLQSLLQRLQSQNVIPPDVSPAKKDGQGNQGPPTELMLPPGWKVEQLNNHTLFSHLEAIVSMVPKEGAINVELVIADGVLISVKRPLGKEVTP